MGLIDHNVGHVRHFRPCVILPSFRISSRKVYDCCTLTIHAYRFCKDARRFERPFAVLERTDGIELTCQIAFDGCRPEITFALGQRNNLGALFIVTLGIDVHFHLFRRIGPERKLGFGGTVNALVFEFRLLARASQQCYRKHKQK